MSVEFEGLLSIGVYYFIKIICRRLGNFEEAIVTSKREKVSLVGVS